MQHRRRNLGDKNKGALMRCLFVLLKEKDLMCLSMGHLGMKASVFSLRQ